LARLDPELLDERGARVAVGLERLGLAACSVEREHQLRAEGLPQRMRRDERLELADELRRAAPGEVGIDPLLLRGEPELLQPRGLERKVDVGERRPAPEREGLAKKHGRALVLGAAGLRDQLLEAAEVELVGGAA
jgi:hypothetical protein